MSPRRPSDAERIADLEEQVHALRGQLKAMQDAIAADAIALRLPVHLAPARRRLLGLLLRGGVKTKSAIYDVLYPFPDADGGPSLKIVDVQISYLRRDLRPLGIEIVTNWSIGYELTPASIETLKGFAAKPSEVAA